MSSSYNDGDAAPPLPLAGEGWGGGLSSSENPQEDRTLTRRAGRCFASPGTRRPLPQAGEVDTNWSHDDEHSNAG
nr:hypothetical protein CIT39_03750 [Bradyrhizobium symbiodeficiens]